MSRITTHFPLSEAVLCLNSGCEAVSNTQTEHCPACGKRGLMPLSTVIGTVNDEQPMSYPSVSSPKRVI